MPFNEANVIWICLQCKSRFFSRGAPIIHFISAQVITHLFSYIRTFGLHHPRNCLLRFHSSTVGRMTKSFMLKTVIKINLICRLYFRGLKDMQIWHCYKMALIMTEFIMPYKIDKFKYFQTRVCQYQKLK